MGQYQKNQKFIENPELNGGEFAIRSNFDHKICFSNFFLKYARTGYGNILFGLENFKTGTPANVVLRALIMLKYAKVFY